MFANSDDYKDLFKDKPSSSKKGDTESCVFNNSDAQLLTTLELTEAEFE